jgi:hypothetical protein
MTFRFERHLQVLRGDMETRRGVAQDGLPDSHGDSIHAGDPPEAAPLEYGYCSRCRDNAEFELDEAGNWLSVCCTAPAIPVDMEPDDF